MSLLANLIQPANMLCKDAAKSRKRVLQSVAETMADADVSADDLFDGLMGRERLGSTGLGEGVAIPHCRTNCQQMQVAMVTLTEPIDYEAIDGEPVDILFVLVVPTQETQAHLDALAELSAVFADADNRARLRQCRQADNLAETMRELLHSTTPPQQRHQA